MIGERFERLVVSARAGTRSAKRMWFCVCDCGLTVTVSTGDLRSGNSRSCGCLKREQSTTHGQHGSRTYAIWQAMHNRCRNPSHQAYPYYGGRGIAVCERWADFGNFIADMGGAPDGLTIDRIDNERGYEADNCRWATRKAQVRHTRRRTEYEHGGTRRSLIEWAETLGVSHELLRGRLRRGWSFEDAIARV